MSVLNSASVVREYTFCYPNICEYTKICFMAQNVVYQGKYPLYTWKECVVCCCWVGCSINDSEVKSVDSAVFSISLLIFYQTCSFNYWKGGSESSIIFGLSNSPYSCISSCIMYFKVLLLDVWTDETVTSPW